MQTNQASADRHKSNLPAERLFVSIIISTIGMQPMLGRCLEGLTEQAKHYLNAEIIVVLNGPENPTFASAMSRFQVRLLNEPRRGVSFARNHAVARARGDILVFVDDDVLIAPNWLEEIVKGFEDPSVCCVTGRVIPAGQLSLTAERHARYYSSERALTSWTLDASDPNWHQYILGEPVGFGCNMAFRKTFLQNYSLFPPDLGAGSLIGGGDEFHMYVQVLKHGFRIRHVPQAAVTHVFEANADKQKARAAQLYAGSVAFALRLFVEEKTLRLATVRWLFSALKRRARHIWQKKTITSEPQELLTPGEKIIAYLGGLGVYWKSRRTRNSMGENREEPR
jgi:cellulose synthase/poly-beta-1,6-N-acetylglucosamine synthase-like glycosyltransferase